MVRQQNNNQFADFDNITKQDLCSDDKMRLLYCEAVRRGFWPNNTGAILEFWTMAEKALKEDKHGTPGKLFYSLIKRKDPSKANDAMEDRATERVAKFRHELVNQAGAAPVVKRKPGPKLERAEVSELLFGRNIGFHHGIMVQCFLPQQSYDAPIWQTDHGKASLMIEAGRIPDPSRPNHFVEKTVPHGSKARLIVPYVQGFAIQHNTPEIDMGESLRRFLDKLGLSVGGKQGRDITRQVENFAASTITLGYWDDEQVTGDRVSVAKRISFWLEKSEEQGALWRPSLTLSTDFFEALRHHRVPVDMDHLLKLARSPRRQDLYVWLNYRLPKLRKPLMMPWQTMQDVFGQGIEDPYKFRQTFKADLKHISGVYDGFNIEPKKDYVQLLPSKSAVPHKITRMIPK